MAELQLVHSTHDTLIVLVYGLCARIHILRYRSLIFLVMVAHSLVVVRMSRAQTSPSANQREFPIIDPGSMSKPTQPVRCAGWGHKATERQTSEQEEARPGSGSHQNGRRSRQESTAVDFSRFVTVLGREALCLGPPTSVAWPQSPPRAVRCHSNRLAPQPELRWAQRRDSSRRRGMPKH